MQRADGGIFNACRHEQGGRRSRLGGLAVCAASLSTFDGGVCNSRGLTWTGTQLAGRWRAMAQYRCRPPVHAQQARPARAGRPGRRLPWSARTVGSTRSIRHGAQHHEGQLSTAEVDDLVKWGGAMAPISTRAAGRPRHLSAGDTVVSNTCSAPPRRGCRHRYAVCKLRAGTLATGKPAFVGVGFGSDFDGLAGWLGAVRRQRLGHGYFTYNEAFVGLTEDAWWLLLLGVQRDLLGERASHVTYRSLTDDRCVVRLVDLAVVRKDRVVQHLLRRRGSRRYGSRLRRGAADYGDVGRRARTAVERCRGVYRIWEAFEVWSFSFGTEQVRGV